MPKHERTYNQDNHLWYEGDKAIIPGADVVQGVEIFSAVVPVDTSDELAAALSEIELLKSEVAALRSSASSPEPVVVPDPVEDLLAEPEPVKVPAVKTDKKNS
jgi:hypothetical protein